MKDYAVTCILNLLNKFYKHRHEKSRKLSTDEFTKVEQDIAKKIWKERCKERERCPRAGVIVHCCDKPGDDQVLLVKYNTDRCSNYGHSKGKIEFGETIAECAAREGNEELGLDFNEIYNKIKDSIPIQKSVPYNIDGLTVHVDHFYFIITVPSKNVNFHLNEHEIDDIEWKSIYTLPCWKKCGETPSMCGDDDDDNSEEYSDYYMATCANFTAATSLVGDILKFLDDKHENKVASKTYQDIHRWCQRREY